MTNRGIDGSTPRRIHYSTGILALFFIICSLCGSIANAASPSGPELETAIVTLGTAGGPRPREDRSQPANLLIVRGTPYLIDAGENVVRQVTAAGIDMLKIGHVFITHNHSDHTMGLPALLATQWEYQRRDPVVIHGPLGTRALGDGLRAFLAVNAEIRSAEGFPASIDDLIKIDEAKPGVIYRDENVTVTAVENTHFHFPPGSKPFHRHVSFALRFDTRDRSVVFAGDTGPSSAIVTLAHGADSLVCEVSAPDELIALYKSNGLWSRKTPQEQKEWLRHQYAEHLTPEAVAELGTLAGVKEIILTHFPPSGIPGDSFERRVDAVRKGFTGKVVAARDLDRF